VHLLFLVVIYTSVRYTQLDKSGFVKMQKMIQKIHSLDEYEDFIRELAGHPLYSDPHFTYDKDNLYRSIKAKDKYTFFKFLLSAAYHHSSIAERHTVWYTSLNES